MTQIVYLTGYSTRTPSEIQHLAQQLNAIVFDIRFSPRSRVHHWSGPALQALLGERYQHIPALGNRNYRNDQPFDIVSYVDGKAEIENNPRPVILLCACSPKDYTRCHRTFIGNQLRAEGFQVQELPPGGVL